MGTLGTGSAIDPEVARITDEFPLHIHHMNINTERDLSDYTKSLIAKTGYKFPQEMRKLVGSHLPVNNVLITLPMMQFYLRMGGKIARVHDIYSLPSHLT